MKLAQSYKQVIVFTLVFLLSSVILEAKSANFLLPQSTAPHSVLENINGQLQIFPVKNSWNLIVYWSLFCHTCISEMPTLQSKLNDSCFKNLKSFFISLDSVRMKQALINFKSKRKLNVTILMEQIASNSYVTADQWGVKMTPSIFIVSPTGVIKFSHEGPVDMELMLQQLRTFLATSSATRKLEYNDK